MTNPLAQDLGGVVLLPCPFCGREPRWYNSRTKPTFHVACWPHGCGTLGPEKSTLAEAIDAWNTRTQRDAERYRFLRRQPVEGGPYGVPRIAIPESAASGSFVSEEDADAAIDTAMQQGGGGE